MEERLLDREDVRTTALYHAPDFVQPVGRAALADDGEGALYALDLPEPPEGNTVWVWLLANDKPVPLGELTNTDVRVVEFTVTGDASAVTGVSLSVEDMGDEPDAPGRILATGQFTR